MTDKNRIELRLSRDMVGQILDGLEVLAEDWEFTCEVDGARACPVDEDRHVRECNGTNEAAAIAATYREILAVIRRQIEQSPRRG